MNVITPPAAVAARWNGALEVRLRRSPLEFFLRARGLRFSATGPAHLTDNIATASVTILLAGIDEFATTRAYLLTDAAYHQTLAQIACAVSEAIACVIQEHAAWRTAALVSAAQILRPFIGLQAAAHVAAAAARSHATTKPSANLKETAREASCAVRANDHVYLQAASRAIVRCLETRAGKLSGVAPALPYDLGGATFSASTT